jgi:hypothetical protein
MDKETFFQEYKGVVAAAIAILVLGVVLLLSFVFSSKKITVKNASGQSASFKAGNPYTIAWKASNVGHVGIVLFNGDKPQWIVQNYPASAGKYVWNSYIYQESGTNYHFAVFEYPWKKGNAIGYSPTAVEIVGDKYASCDDYSVGQGWTFLPDTYPNLHKVFITSTTYSASLGGLDGADAICNKEAQNAEYKGNYVAFIGSDTVSASERITKGGVFVEAAPVATLTNGHSCNRIVGTNLQNLLDNTRLTKTMGAVELSSTFYRLLGDIWYGRRTSSTDSKCLQINMLGVVDAYSSTYTCDNWSINKRQVYYDTIPADADLPGCYNTTGKNIKANYYGATVGNTDDSGNLVITGDTCDSTHHLMCVEQ